MKRLLLSLAVTALLCHNFEVLAYNKSEEFSSADLRYYRLSATNKTCALIGQGASGASITQGISAIPTAVTLGGQTYTVVQIGYVEGTAANYTPFKNNTNIQTISIPSTVKKIDNNAFEGCSNLKSFSINANGSITIGDEVFRDCKAMQILSLRANQDITTGYQSFINCTSLSEVSLNATNSLSVGEESFYNLGIKTLNLGESYSVSIGAKAFAGMHYINDLAIKGKGTITIGTSAFADSYDETALIGMKSITISAPRAVTIGHAAFTNSRLVSSIIIDTPAKLTIDSQAFTNNRGLKSLDLGNPASLSVGDDAFQLCTTLEKASLKSAGDISLGSQAFQYCYMLSAISFFTSSNLTIGSNAVSECGKNASTKLYVSLGTGPELLTSKLTLDANAFYKTPLNYVDIFYSNANTKTKGSSFNDTEDSFSNCGTNIPLYGPDKDALLHGSSAFSFMLSPEAPRFLRAKVSLDIENVNAVNATSVEVFNLQGLKVAESTENLPSGIYIVKSGTSVNKVKI